MANPVSVGGIKKIVDKVNEEVIQAANKAAKRKGEKFNVEGRVNVRGNFGFDKAGDFGFVGNVIAEGPTSGNVGVDIGEDWNSAGDGTLELEFHVTVTRDGTDDEVQ